VSEARQYGTVINGFGALLLEGTVKLKRRQKVIEKLPTIVTKLGYAV
jgi:hypothetical protein